MCGLIAIFSSRTTAGLCQQVIDGLHRMEYRGYDSAGILLSLRGNSPKYDDCKKRGEHIDVASQKNKDDGGREIAKNFKVIARYRTLERIAELSNASIDNDLSRSHWKKTALNEHQDYIRNYYLEDYILDNCETYLLNTNIELVDRDQERILIKGSDMGSISTQISNLAMGHTRWATHGKVSIANAHPILYNDIAIIHNGTVENFLEIRGELEGEGYVFQTNTDTEVIAALLWHYYSICNRDQHSKSYQNFSDCIKNACEAVLNKARGMYSFVAYAMNTNCVAAVNNGLPLAVGGLKDSSDNFDKIYFASDVLSFCDRVPQYMRMERGQILIVSSDEENFYIDDHDGYSGKIMINGNFELTFSESTSDIRSDLNTFSDIKLNNRGGSDETFMRKEIIEQSKTLERLAEIYGDYHGENNETLKQNTINKVDESNEFNGLNALKVYEANISQYHDIVQDDNNEIARIFKNIDLSRIQRVHMIACGSSFYAAQVARYIIEENFHISVYCDIASEFAYRSPVLSSDTLYVFISQSGETADVISAIRYVNKYANNYSCNFDTDSIRDHPTVKSGVQTIAITNRADSALTRETSATALLYCGYEISVAATKSFLSQIVTLGYLSAYMFCDHKRFKEACYAMNKLSNHLDNLIGEIELQTKILAGNLQHAGYILFAGRGGMYPVAMEASLKMKELSYIPSDAVALGELKHGTIALIDSNSHIVVFCGCYDDGIEREKVFSNIEEILARGGNVYLIGDDELCARLDENICGKIILRPNLCNNISSNIKNIQQEDALNSLSKDIYSRLYSRMREVILSSIAAQFIAYYTSKNLGRNIDMPRNLAKSLTVE